MRKYIFILAFLCCNVSFCQTITEFDRLKNILFENNVSIRQMESEKEYLQAEKKQNLLWENPTVSAIHNVYNPINKSYFDISKQGETDIELEIPIINFSKTNATKQKYNYLLQSKEYEIQSLKSELKNMLLQLLVDYYYYYNEEKLYNDEVLALQDIVSAYEIQYNNKNISSLEFSNLQFMFFNLQNEVLQVQINKQNTYFEIIKLLNTNTNLEYHSVLNVNSVFEQANSFLLTAINDSLLAFRYDILALESENTSNLYAIKEFQKDNLPSWSLKTEWDKNGSIDYNIFLVGFSMKLPIFNRNQGNIHSKKIENEMLFQKKDFLMNNYRKELVICVENLRKYCTLYANNNRQSLIDNDKLAKDMRQQLKNRNISLLDYQNFTNNYRQMRLLQIETEKNLLQTASKINTITNKEIFIF